MTTRTRPTWAAAAVVAVLAAVCVPVGGTAASAHERSAVRAAALPPMPERQPEPPYLALDPSSLVYGQPRTVGVGGTPSATVDVYAVTLPEREFRLVATAELGDLGVGEFTLPGLTGTTLLFAQDRERGLHTPPFTLTVHRAVSLEAAPVGDRTRFAGSVEPPVAGLPVTLARVDVNGRVTGLLGTTTDAQGRYSFTAALDDGAGPLTVLTGAGGGLAGGRSRDLGRPWPRIPSVTLHVTREASGAYRFSGSVTPGRSVPVTLARLVDGRRVGLAGTRSGATGTYSVTRHLAPGLYAFQVVTGPDLAYSWGLSRQYGLRVP